MELVYIVGSYRGKTCNEIRENIRKAEKLAVKLWQEGYGVICPHLNSAFMDGLVDDEQFLEAGLLMIKGCDYICMLDGWKRSDGSRKEVAFAIKHNKGILFAKNYDSVLANGGRCP